MERVSDSKLVCRAEKFADRLSFSMTMSMSSRSLTIASTRATNSVEALRQSSNFRSSLASPAAAPTRVGIVDPRRQFALALEI